jgi:hypothetical protein
VTTQSVGTTLDSTQTSSLGELDGASLSGSLLTLSFTGAYNTKDIQQVIYSVERYSLDETTNLPVTDSTWDAVTIEQEEGTNLFTQDEGSTSIGITLNSDIIAEGKKYRMQIRCLNASGNTVYENTVSFE